MTNLIQFRPGFKPSKPVPPAPKLTNMAVEAAFSQLSKTSPVVYALSNMAWHISDFASLVIKSTAQLTDTEAAEIARHVEDVYVAAMKVDDLLRRMELGRRK